MNCMRCGRKVDDGVFCRECRADMERHPVPAGTALVLPTGKADPPSRKSQSRKKEPTAEELLRRLQSRTKRLTLALVCMTLAFALMTTALVLSLVEKEPAPTNEIGKNYSTMDPTDAT